MHLCRDEACLVLSGLAGALLFDDDLHFAGAMHTEDQLHFDVARAAGAADEAEVGALGKTG